MTTSLAHVRQFGVELPDGRTLHCYQGGDPHGPLVVYHHGTPSCGLLRREWVKGANELGIRLVGYDRAGYGGSSRKPGRTISDIGADMAALADHLEADRFRTWGVSGGGPHALATATVLGDRVIAAAAVASVAPYDAADLDFLAGMGQDNLDEFGAAMESEASLQSYLEAASTQLRQTSAAELREAMISLLPPVDRRYLTGQAAEYLHGTIVSGLRAGTGGWADDDLAFVSPWGFDTGAVGCPLLIVQGEEDLMVPLAHGKWLADAYPAAEVRLLAGEGHVSLMAKVAEVHEWLLGVAG